MFTFVWPIDMLLSSLCFEKHQKVWRYRIRQSLKLRAHIYFSCPVGIVEALSFTQKGKTDPGNAEFMPNMFCILQSICHILQHSCFILQNICFVLQYICLLWEGDEWWLTCAIYAKNLVKKLPNLQPPVSGSQRLGCQGKREKEVNIVKNFSRISQFYSSYLPQATDQSSRFVFLSDLSSADFFVIRCTK